MTIRTYNTQKDCNSNVSCPILYALDLINQKWKVPILWHISQCGTLRYGELQRKLVGVTGTMLSSALKELCNSGILERTVKEAKVDQVSYSFTAKGSELIPILDQLVDWGTDKMLDDGYPKEAILSR